jgi:peptide/nickel transport system permease protein
MISNGTTYLPNEWWLTVFPALGILALVFGFNWLGDGLKDILDVDL